MPSTNPDLTPVYKLPSPVPGDPPDVPGDIQALAVAVEQTIQSGTVAVHVPTASGSLEVTFPSPFASPPAVVASHDNAYFRIGVTAVTATKFRIDVADSRNQTYNADLDCHWIAIGQRA